MRLPHLFRRLPNPRAYIPPVNRCLCTNSHLCAAIGKPTFSLQLSSSLTYTTMASRRLGVGLSSEFAWLIRC